MDRMWELHDYHGHRIAARHPPLADGEGTTMVAFFDGHAASHQTDWMYNADGGGQMHQPAVQQQHQTIFDVGIAGK